MYIPTNSGIQIFLKLWVNSNANYQYGFLNQPFGSRNLYGYANPHGFYMDLKISYGLWTGYGMLILDEKDYGLDLDKESDPFGPSGWQL